MSYAAIAGAVIGVVGGAVNANKNKPGAPVYQAPLDIGTTSKNAINTDIGNEGSADALAAQTNQFNQSQATSLFNQAFPQYQKLSSTLGSQAEKLAANPYSVPQDVQDNLSRIAAEKGISVAGTSAGQSGQFSLLRDLGVNELQYGQQNLSTASGITSLLGSLAPKVSPMSPASFYVTPNNAADIANGNATNAQATSQSYNNALAKTNAQNSSNQWNSFANLGGLLAGNLFGSGKNGSQGGGSYGGTVTTTAPGDDF